ncbi:MAG: urease accessory protein UreD [Micropruina sp.]|nr:urease accessory protein UreD [Micropruina sp.]
MLRWHSQPLVVCDGADVRRTLVADLAADSGLFLDETVVLGRHGETGGVLDSQVTITGQDGVLLVERLGYHGDGDPDQERFLRPGRRIRTRSAFGRCAEELLAGPDEVLFEVAGGGRLIRSFGDAGDSVG